MKARYFFKVLGITIFSLFLLNSLVMAQIHYDSTGKVGIGTTTPSQKLDVDGTVKATAFDLNGDTITSWSNGSGDGDGHSLDAADGNPVDAVYVDNGGNVGIGTTSPAEKLHVYGTDAATIAQIECNSDGAAQLELKGDGVKWAMSKRWGAQNDRLDFYYHDGALWSPGLLTLEPSGNVGIGTTSPAEKLHIYGTGTRAMPIIARIECENNDCGAQLQLESGGATWAIAKRSESENDRLGFYYNGTDYHDPNSWSTVLTLEPSGNVGIGTTSPSRKLDVAGNVIANAYEHHSDSRLKKNVASIDNALDKVLALHGVEFEWRTEEYPEKGFAEGRKIGLIAQEVEQVIPEVVSIDNEGYKSVEYGNIVSVLIEAIKVQQAQIEELKARIELLEH